MGAAFPPGRDGQGRAKRLLDSVWKMERLGLLSLVILMDFSSALDHSLVKVATLPTDGVVLVSGPEGNYQFNFTEALEACLLKDLYIATKDQLQTARDHGLESCRFGWISEGIAVVPRVSSVFTCGSGLLGLVTWNASKSKKFAVWCFNASSDSEENVKASTVAPKIPTKSAETTLQTTAFTTTTVLTTATTTTTTTATTSTTTTTALPETTTSAATTLPKTSKATNPTTTGATSRESFTSIPWIQTSAASQTVSTQFSTTAATSLLDLIHSSSLAGSTETSSSHVMTSQPHKLIINGQSVLSTALWTIVFSVIVLILCTGGALFYYKISKHCAWSHAALKDDAETEMWRQTNGELDPRKEGEDEWRAREEEEKRFTISSENMQYTADPQ